MMILPNNGKVIIIDDDPNDVRNLANALTREKMPFLFFKDLDMDDLPESPVSNVRLVFLDLDLGLGGNSPIEKIRIVQGRIERIIERKTPYMLIIWSQHEDQYLKTLEDEFKNGFRDFKPIGICTLEKSKVKKMEREDTKTVINHIREELRTQLTQFESFNAFLLWESIVNESSGKLTNDITSLYPIDEDWNKKTKFLLYKLAVAYSGKTVDGFSHNKKLKNALYTLTMSFTENIENIIEKRIDDSFNNIISDSPQPIDNFTSVINKFLLISEGNDDVTQPGNLFFIDLEIEEENKRIHNKEIKFKDTIGTIPENNRKKAIEGHEKSIRKENQELEEFSKAVTKKSNDITVSALSEEAYNNQELKSAILKTVLPIKLNVTPLCDYAQEKAKLFRILPGVIVKAEYRKYFNSSGGYSYMSDADFRINDDNYLFLFDFRFLVALDKGELHGLNVKYRVRQQLLSDIQVKLGAHINRSGVLYVS